MVRVVGSRRSETLRAINMIRSTKMTVVHKEKHHNDEIFDWVMNGVVC